MLTGVTLEDRLPPNEYLEYYGPDFRLQPSVPQDKPNQNSPEYLEEVLIALSCFSCVFHASYGLPGLLSPGASQMCCAHTSITAKHCVKDPICAACGEQSLGESDIVMRCS